MRGGVLLDANHELLAGPPALATMARALAEAMQDAAELEVVSPRGVVCAVRSNRHVVLAVCGRFALPGVTRADLRVALAALEGTSPRAAAEPRPEGSGTALDEAAEALISAVQRQSGRNEHYVAPAKSPQIPAVSRQMAV